MPLSQLDLIVLGLLIIGAVVWMVYDDVQEQNCEKRGGVMAEDVCLKPGAIMP